MLKGHAAFVYFQINIILIYQQYIKNNLKWSLNHVSIKNITY